MNWKRPALVLLLALALSAQARAQFVVPGDDPGSLRWYSLESAFYRVIYPEGAESLARSYARLLEQFRQPIGASFGFTPGEGMRKKMPVVLHTHHVYSNGSVAWAPYRFDLFTLPPAYDPDPTPWDIQLASHEPRHQAQLQAWSRSFGKPLTWLIGQAWNPVGWQVYLNRIYGEGDAVVGETGLWKGNRARTADFLDYYRMSFDQGQFRSWSYWRYDSFKHHVPDVYALGYLTLAGGRYFYDRPLLVQESVQSSLKNPLRFSPWNMQHHVARAGGFKHFKQAFRDLQERYDSLWRGGCPRAVHAPGKTHRRGSVPRLLRKPCGGGRQDLPAPQRLYACPGTGVLAGWRHAAHPPFRPSQQPPVSRPGLRPPLLVGNRVGHALGPGRRLDNPLL